MAQVDKTHPEQQHGGMSEEQARAERDAVLHLVGGDIDGLRARCDTEGLTNWEWCVLSEYEALEERLSA